MPKTLFRDLSSSNQETNRMLCHLYVQSHHLRYWILQLTVYIQARDRRFSNWEPKVKWKHEFKHLYKIPDFHLFNNSATLTGWNFTPKFEYVEPKTTCGNCLAYNFTICSQITGEKKKGWNSLTYMFVVNFLPSMSNVYFLCVEKWNGSMFLVVNNLLSISLF